MIQAHEFVEGFCKWCGIPAPGSNSTCLQREIPKSELAPEPARRQYACEDADTIAARLTELAKERLPEAVTTADFDLTAAAAYC